MKLTPDRSCVGREFFLSLLGAVAMTTLGFSRTAGATDMRPTRTIADTDPNFNTLWVDTVHDEILVGNDAQETLQVYSRTADGEVGPLREIGGQTALITFPGQVFIDPAADEIYSIGNDIADQVTVYHRLDNGDVQPLRVLSWKSLRFGRVWGLYVDTVNDELFIPLQNGHKITVWRRLATTGETPIRTIGGPSTQLASPHGVFVDTFADEIYVMNVGHSEGLVTSPYITVYDRTASDDAAPKRMIAGSMTGLNASKAMFVDTENGEIVTANGSPYDAVLVFSAQADGDVAPVRILHGSSTGLSNPTGVFVDNVNDELLVANWGNHTITVYPRAAGGDVEPKRTITPSKDKVAVGIGNPGAIYLDLLHGEIGVTNCVSHPRIAIFDRLANGVVAPLRVIQGSQTGLTRSMHGIAVDNVNDEIIAPGNVTAAILVFSRDAEGDVPPVRQIIGPKTSLRSPQGVAVDTTNHEILVAEEGARKILVFDRTATGDAAPKREIAGPNTGLTTVQHVAVDPVHDEIIVSDKGNRAINVAAAIYVFPRLQDGDGAPTRTIQGDATLIIEPRQIAYDPVNDEIALADRHRFQDFIVKDPGIVAAWDRNANGNVPPKRFIQGPLSTMTSPRAVYVDAQNNELGVGDTNTHAILIYPRNFE